MADVAQDSCQKCVEHSRPAVAAARHAAGPTSEAVQSSSNIKSAKLLVCSCNWLMLQEMRRKGRQNVLVEQEHNCVILVPPPPLPRHISSPYLPQAAVPHLCGEVVVNVLQQISKVLHSMLFLQCDRGNHNLH